MVFDLDRKYLAAAAAMLVGLAALVATSLQAPTQLRSDVADVDRGRDLRMQVQDLHVSLLNLESSERGYLLTQDAAYLTPFHSDLAGLDEQLAALSSATTATATTTEPTDDADDAADVRRLRDLVEARRAELTQTLALADTQGVGAALLMVRDHRGKALMDQIRAVLSQMELRAASAQAQRHAARTASIRRSARLVSLLGAAITLLLAVLYVLIRRDKALQAHIRQTEAEARQELEQRVAERTAALEATSRSLARSEARLQGIFDSATDAILTTDAAQVIVDANPAAARLFRCAKPDLIGMSLDKLIPNRYRPSHRHEVRRFGASTAPGRRMRGSREVTGLRADGAEVPIDASISRLDIGGERLYTVFLRDASVRRQTEEALRESKAKLETALASMNDAVFISDAEGGFREFNDAFVAFHRFDSREACHRALTESPDLLEIFLADGEPAPREAWAVTRALRGEVASNVEYQLRRKDTGQSWVGSYSFAPIRSSEGHVVGSVVTGRDVTDIKKAQADLSASHAELQHLIANQHRIQEDERKRIARELHDDLQQSLAAIRMDAVAISERLASGRGGVEALLARIDTLSANAIASTRRIVSDLRPEMLEDLGLVAALELLTQQFGERTGTTCTLVTDDDLADELASQPTLGTCLFRVVQESLNNIVKHAHASEVRVHLSCGADRNVRLSVTDNGRGMPMNRPRGTHAFGLRGMSERVRAVGGHLRVEGRPGAGTSVDVVVPLDGLPNGVAN